MKPQPLFSAAFSSAFSFVLLRALSLELWRPLCQKNRLFSARLKRMVVGFSCLGAVFLGASPLTAFAQTASPPTLSPVLSSAQPAQTIRDTDPSAAGVPVGDLAANAPDRYTVKKGDTLWGLSALFLKSPWQWPQLWSMNKTLVKNPHLIYPGQALELIRSGGRATLGFAQGVDGLPSTRLSPANPAGAGLSPSRDVKLSPIVRAESLESQPIASVQLEAVAQFLSRPLILDEPAMSGSGYILTGPENRVYAGVGDIVYARGLPAGQERRFQVYRPGKPLHDPDTRALIAYEAYDLGVVEIVQEGDPARLKVLSSKEEMGRGDRLLPAVGASQLNFSPRAPENPVSARVMSTYSGVTFAGSNMVVTLNKGRKDGLELGHVLAVWRDGMRVQDAYKTDESSAWSRVSQAPEGVKLPDEKYGQLIVFRLFENVAYALVLGTTLPVVIGDRVTHPQLN